jgi:hypothetical protein
MGEKEVNLVNGLADSRIVIEYWMSLFRKCIA